MYEPLKVSKCEKCGRVIAEPKELIDFWRELTRSLIDFKNYWSEFCTMKEWETVKQFHLELRVTLPKDLAETKA